MSKSQFAQSLEKLDPEQLERVTADLMNENRRRSGGDTPNIGKMSDQEFYQHVADCERDARKAKANG